MSPAIRGVIDRPERASNRPPCRGEGPEQVPQLPVAEPSIVGEGGLGTEAFGEL
jgi:hypothetical protein